MPDRWWWPSEVYGASLEDREGLDGARLLDVRRSKVDALPAIRLTEVAEWLSPAPGHVLLDVGVGPSGELLALWCAGRDRALFEGTRAPQWQSPSPEAAAKVPVTITRHEVDGRWSVLATVRGLAVEHPVVQPLPDKQVLVAGTACELRASGPDRNAYVLDRDGHRVLQGTIGDGIETLQATATGDIWAGFADTGIYGNNGWGEPDDARSIAPIGESGLVRFDRGLVRRWEFDASGQAGRPRWPIVNVYAMNVVGDVAWIYYYDDWDIVRVEDGRLRLWRTSSEGGATEMLVNGDTIALVGGYPPEHDLVRTGTLGADRLEAIQQSRLVLPDGAHLPPTVRMSARGNTLHVVTPDMRYKLELN